MSGSGYSREPRPVGSTSDLTAIADRRLRMSVFSAHRPGGHRHRDRTTQAMPSPSGGHPIPFLPALAPSTDCPPWRHDRRKSRHNRRVNLTSSSAVVRLQRENPGVLGVWRFEGMGKNTAGAGHASHAERAARAGIVRVRLLSCRFHIPFHKVSIVRLLKGDNQPNRVL